MSVKYINEIVDYFVVMLSSLKVYFNFIQMYYIATVFLKVEQR
jgi:hypothetical protein